MGQFEWHYYMDGKCYSPTDLGYLMMEIAVPRLDTLVKLLVTKGPRIPAKEHGLLLLCLVVQST